MFFKGKNKGKKFFNLKPVQVLALGMIGFVAIGTILLMLPISSNNRATSFIDALFTSTSAVCVTGLTVVDTGTHWSIFGQIVIILLVQIGGIGFMTFATLIVVLLGKKVSLKERLIVMEAYNAFNIQGLVRLVIYVISITFAIEGIGTLILTTQFMQEYPLGKSLYFGIFHSISAFCNAGFDLFGDFMGYTGYVTNTIVSFVIATLIIIGGLGFFVITEVLNHNYKRKRKRYSLHTRVVFIVTFTLIIIGAVLFFILEYNNSKTMGDLPFSHKITASIFASVTPRSGGISTVSKSDMTTASHFLTVILMFIGASPGSTGGGIKTTNLMVILASVYSMVSGREDIEIFKKRINKNLVYKAISITLISFIAISITTIILSITEEGTFMEFLYEATSAFGTVGLSLGITPDLTPLGKVVITLAMYVGRVGPLSLVFAFAYKQKRANSSIKYPEDKIIVG